MVVEDWAEVEGFPNYAVSNLGEVHNIKFGREVRQRANGQGYFRVELSEKGAPKQFYVHQLVAQYFLEDWAPGVHVRHKDNDRSNNQASNLLLRTPRIAEEYIPHRRGRPPRGRRVQIVETGEVFLSARETARHIGGDYSSIYRSIRQPWSAHKGYHFRYYEETD